jgi:hypothetical protein
MVLVFNNKLLYTASPILGSMHSYRRQTERLLASNARILASVGQDDYMVTRSRGRDAFEATPLLTRRGHVPPS